MKKLAILLGVGILSLSASQMRADGIGTTVAGSLNLAGYGTTNYFSPTNGFVPLGYGNSSPGSASVVIGSEVEYAFAGKDLYTGDFTGNTLTISDTKVSSFSDLSWVMTFTDPSFLGFTLVSNSLGISSYSFSGDTLTVDFTTIPGAYSGGTAVFDYATPTPEPASIALFATGLLGIAGVVRRRFNS